MTSTPCRYITAARYRQIPQQFECALSFLSTQRPQHILTVGTWSGWTDAFLNAYLRRFARDPSAFTHVTFDIQAIVQPCIGALLAQLGTRRVVFGTEPLVDFSVQDMKRARCAHAPKAAQEVVDRGGCNLKSWLANGLPNVKPRAEYDLCFIDGNHDYGPAASDFYALRPRCRNIMFHDIVNVRVGLRNVPRLWKELAARASPTGTQPPAEGWPADAYEYEVKECVYQPAQSDQQMMGIGLLRALTPIPMKTVPVARGSI